MHPAFDPKDFAVIGKLHARSNPTAALSLIEQYQQARSQATDTNLSNLYYYFLAFCKIHNLQPSEYLGSLHAADKTDRRRLFIACMIRVYTPEVLQYDLLHRPGLNQGLCRLLRYNAGNVNKTIKEVTEWMKSDLYGFNEQVQETFEQLTAYKQSGFVALKEAA